MPVVPVGVGMYLRDGSVGTRRGIWTRTLVHEAQHTSHKEEA